jgi:hypothetical protein
VAQARSPFGNASPEKLALNGPAISGKLTDKSNVLPADNSFFDLYSFEGKAGQQITIEMKSQEIDPYLILLGPNQRGIAQDDDGAGSKNARITVRLPADGTYTLVANSYEARRVGGLYVRTESECYRAFSGDFARRRRFSRRRPGTAV